MKVERSKQLCAERTQDISIPWAGYFGSQILERELYMFVLDVKLPGVYTNTRDRAVHNFIQVSIQESVFCLASGDQAPAPTQAPATWGAWEAWSRCRPKNGFPRGQKSR